MKGGDGGKGRREVGKRRCRVNGKRVRNGRVGNGLRWRERGGGKLWWDGEDGGGRGHGGRGICRCGREGG